MLDERIKSLKNIRAKQARLGKRKEPKMENIIRVEPEWKRADKKVLISGS